MFNTSIMITIIMTIVSAIIGMYLGSTLKQSDPPTTQTKIIVKTVSQIANVLARIQGGIENCSPSEKINLINALLEVLVDEDHPDADILHHVASAVENNQHPSHVYEIWLTLAYRRLAADGKNRLPEPWFIEPAAAAPPADLDISEISETSTEDEYENEGGPLVSPAPAPAPAKPYFCDGDDDLNTARIYTPECKLVDLDMSAVD